MSMIALCRHCKGAIQTSPSEAPFRWQHVHSLRPTCSNGAVAEPLLEVRPEHPDAIDHPSHYQGAVEVIDVIEAYGLNFHLGNVVKYVLRAERKGAPIEDLKKASWYLAREIARREGA